MPMFRLIVVALLLLPLTQLQAAPRKLSKEVQERVKAAQKADPAAQYRLGLDFRAGENGVPKDPAQAYKWIHQAALGNLAPAQFTAGQMDQAGEGPPRKGALAEAVDWYRKAAKQNYMPAILALASMLRHGEGAAVDLAGAANLYRTAADRNDVPSQLLMGQLYARGEGVFRNLTDSAVWYRRAAQLGNAEGRFRLALILLGNEPLGGLKSLTQRDAHHPTHDSREAVMWLHLACEQNYAPAQYALAMSIWGGITQPFDGGQALSLLLLAGDQGYVPALRKLAEFYGNGRVVAKDPGRALMYLELADQLSATQNPLGVNFIPTKERDDLQRDLQPTQQQAAKKRAQEWLQSHGL